MKTQKKAKVEVSVPDALDGLEDLLSTPNIIENQGIWAEPQLYLLPFCVPQDRDVERFRTIKISETVKINEQVKHRSFIVNPHPELGLPGSFELEVMTGIYKLADDLIVKNGMVPEYIELGTFRSFLETIGRPGSGKYIKMLKEALRRLAGTTCISEGFFYCKPRDLYVIESFTFITSLQIAGESDFNENVIQRTTLRLHEFIRENLNSNFRTLIDFNYLRSLKTTIAKSLSLHIAYRVFKNGKSVWEPEYTWLADRLAIKIQTEIKRAKDQLKPALLELQRTGLLEHWEWLPGGKIRFVAGDRIFHMHNKRVAAKDAWIASQARATKKGSLIPRTEKEAKHLEVYDPLAPLCTEYAVRGWAAVQSKASKKNLDEQTLKMEAMKRGFTPA